MKPEVEAVPVHQRMDNRKASSRKTPGLRRSASFKKDGAAHQPAGAGTIARTKALLLAAMRVWELNHRVGEKS